MRDLEECVRRAEGEYAELKLSRKCAELREREHLFWEANSNSTGLNIGKKRNVLFPLHCCMEAAVQSFPLWRVRQRSN